MHNLKVQQCTNANLLAITVLPIECIYVCVCVLVCVYEGIYV